MIDHQFPSIISTRLEGHHGTPISILLKEDARPKFIKARRVSYALQQITTEALKSMINQGMLIPVMESAWASPAHFVRKYNGKIRVVGDYKDTVNPEIKDSE